MFVLEKNKLFPVMMFDKKDPREYTNLLKFKIHKKEIDELANFLVKERRKFLLMRKVDIENIMNKKYKWVVDFSFIEKSFTPPPSYR